MAFTVTPVSLAASPIFTLHLPTLYRVRALPLGRFVEVGDAGLSVVVLVRAAAVEKLVVVVKRDALVPHEDETHPASPWNRAREWSPIDDLLAGRVARDAESSVARDDKHAAVGSLRHPTPRIRIRQVEREPVPAGGRQPGRMASVRARCSRDGEQHDEAKSAHAT